MHVGRSARNERIAAEDAFNREGSGEKVERFPHGLQASAVD